MNAACQWYSTAGNIVFEIQYHPASIRKGVKFFFLSGRQVRRWIAGVLVALVVVAAGLATAPRGVGAVVLGLLSRVAQVRQQREMADMERHLEETERLLDALERSRRLQNRLSLVFGMPSVDSFAGGGMPDRASVGPVGRSVAAVDRAENLMEEVDSLMGQAALLDELLSRRDALIRAVPSICPLPDGSFVLSSPFGARTSPFTGETGFHAGLDLAAQEGTPVLASGDGIVSFAGWVPASQDVRWWRMGNVVVVDHHGLYTTVYAHLAEVRVEEGDSLHRGQVIGTVGSTGWSTSPHLHYEVRTLAPDGEGSVALDPRIFILNHDWNEDDAVLVASRWAPPPPVDPLPNLLEVR